MKVEVSTAIEEVTRQFPDTAISTREDGQGGAYVVIERVPIGPRFTPMETWMGFQIPAQYPYADIYPVFIGGEVVRADGILLVAPVTAGHSFEGRPAIQVSRRNSAAQNGMQRVSAKLLKVLNYLETMP